MTKLGVPPGMSAKKAYVAQIEIMLAMLADADVHVKADAPPAGFNVVVPTSGPTPVLGTGSGKIK